MGKSEAIGASVPSPTKVSADPDLLLSPRETPLSFADWVGAPPSLAVSCGGFGVSVLLGVSSLSIANSCSNSAGSGPFCGTSPSFRSPCLALEDLTAGEAARETGFLAPELDLEGADCADR